MAGLDEIHISDPGAVAASLEVLADGVLMVQMPTVFVLLAPANDDGAARLDAVKVRQPNKNYGTALGDLESFRRMASPGSLPDELAGPDALRILTGAFIRIAVAAESTDTVMVRAGTHQGLLLEGPHRELFRAIEAGLGHTAQPSIIGGHTFTAPLCTSANYSGHPDGSIVDGDIARAFAVERGLPLLVRAEADPGTLGSYPIFWLRPDRISVERDGPGLDELRAALPQRLFAD